MISNVFEFYYTMNMHPVRLKPLTREELGRGMTPDTVDKYLSLVEKLYHAFYFDVNAKFVPPSEEEHRQRVLTRVQVHNELIKLLFKQDAISDGVYCELHESMALEFGFIEHPGVPGTYISDSLDDFRLAFEYSLVESDQHTDLGDNYLDERYGYSICVRPDTPSGLVASKDLCVIRFEGTSPNIRSVQASYWEVRQLLKTIRQDMENNTNEQERLDEVLCKSNGAKRSYMDSLQKTTYGRPKNAAEWYTTKRALDREAEYLWGIEDQISRIFDTMEKPNDGVGFGATLFIYKGRVLCHQHKHPLVPATALIHDDQDREIELDVEYCPICKRYMLNYTSYEQYRERHGLLIGKMKMISASSAGGEFEMASEGPLKLCGYDFVGWSMDQTPTESSVIYQDEEKVVNLTSEKGAVVTLYAQWKECDHNEIDHTYTYSLINNGTTIKRDCSCGNYSEEVRLSADRYVYDQTNHPANVVYTSETWKPVVIYQALGNDALVNDQPYYAGRYMASVTAGGVTASITYPIEKAKQVAPEKPEYTTELVNGGSVLKVFPVSPSPLAESDPDGYDSVIEYKLVYYVGGEKQTEVKRTAQNPTELIEGTYAVRFNVDVVLTNYYIYACFAEGSNHWASYETPADNVYFFAGENVEIIVNNPEGILKELQLAGSSGDNIVQNGAVLSLELVDGYYFPADYDSNVTCVATTIPDGQPADGVQFIIESPCTKYSIQNIKESTRIVITLPDAYRLAEMSHKITEGQVFGNVTSDTATISRDSAFTVYYEVKHFVTSEYGTPILSFGSAIPVGTTIIMQDKQTGGYYWYMEKDADATGLALSDFVRMGDVEQTPFTVTDGDLNLQFIIDYSQTESGIAGDAVDVTLQITQKNTSNLTKSTAVCSLKAVDEFSLTEADTGVLTFQRNYSAGIASKWEMRESALVLIPKTTLPVDAQLSLVCAGVTKIIRANCNGHFIYSVPADATGTISTSLISSLLPEGTSSYDFDVKWIVAESQVEQAPMNASEVASIVHTVACTQQTPVSLKIGADKKLYAVADTVHANINWADVPATYDMEVVLLVKAADGNYISTGITRKIYFSDSTGTMDVDISLGSVSNGSYCLQITTDHGLIRVAEARYYFIVQ